MIALIPTFALAVPAQQFEVLPARVARGELDPGLFDKRWELPDRPEGRDFEEEMRALVELDFREDGRIVRFGDLVSEARDVEGARRAEWLRSLETRAPELVRERGESLWQLFLDDHLFSDDWRPAVDHARDGILMADGWKPGEHTTGVWKELEPRFEQAAALFHSDLVAIKRVENDYSTYLDHVGTDYLEIYPVRDGHLAGEDEAGLPFRFVRIYFRCDLPFPFSSYACDLRILNRVDAEGVLRTDIYSPSSDFHYLAGSDVFLPVRDSSDEIVAYLLVRDFGFDIDDVPDRRRHRAEALRGSLGNLKRKAERVPRPGGGAFPTAREALSRLRVVGSRTR